MKRLLSAATIAALSCTILSAYQIDVKPGWQLKGALSDIDVHTFDNPNIVSVWTYDDISQSWKVYLPNNSTLMNSLPSGISPLNYIKKSEGFWVNSMEYTNIETGDEITSIDMSSADSFIDTPSNFNLSDVAGKIFTIYDYYSDNISSFNVAMDENGVANVVDPDGNNYIAKLENGTINVYDLNSTLVTSFKKLAMDENGVVVVGYDTDQNGNIVHTFIEPWLITEPTPVDMGTKLPYVMYNSWDGDHYMVFESNLTVSNYFYNYETQSYEKDNYSYYEDTLTIENGALVGSEQDEWFDENNVSHKFLHQDSLQVINSIGRYDVVQIKGEYTESYVDPSLIGKTWNDIIDSNTSIFWYTINGDGTINTEYDSDENITYSIDNNILTITHTYCYENECNNWSENFNLNSTTGEVTLYNSYSNMDVVSSSPIVKITNHPTTTTTRVLNKSLQKADSSRTRYDEIVKMKSELLKKKWF